MELEKQFLFQMKHFIMYDGFKGSLPDDFVLNKALCETWHCSLQEIKTRILLISSTLVLKGV